MICFIYGTDHYRCREQLKALKNQFIHKRDQSGGLNVITLDVATFDFDQFRQELLTVPFLGEKKMIVVKNILSQKKKYESIDKFIKGREFDNALVFMDLLINEKKSWPKGDFFNYLKRQKFVWHFDLMNNFELEKWIKQNYADNNTNINQQAAKELSLRVGNDLQAMETEIKKLSAYKNGKTINADDVRLIVRAKFDENIFNLIDAIALKNKNQATKLLADQLNSGQSPLMILTMIIRQFRIIIQLKDGPSTGLKLHPFVIKKATQQEKNFSWPTLKTIYSDLLELEKSLKTSSRDPELLFDLFILKNC